MPRRRAAAIVRVGCLTESCDGGRREPLVPSARRCCAETRSLALNAPQEADAFFRVLAIAHAKASLPGPMSVAL
jgi:hypothetical protein